ncbi:hypothetical protein B0T22DRAFT_370081 [Podospora appendiculata]|uniref:Uncharacterized protein n=1 Tax=Podospora appendiculata TaxID=314037 RepID=A0AAE0XGH7_9PEZI|nr:hypothetical protein B0T22DRAFT_370081 [Podospora appendiculata]
MATVTAFPTAFPLQAVSTSHLRALCRVLWDWHLCDNCRNPTNNRWQCQTDGCPWEEKTMYGRLELFFDLYRELTRAYVPDFFGDEDQALRGHHDLFDIMLLLKTHGATLTRDECRAIYFAHRGTKGGPLTIARADQDRAFDLASRVMTMAAVAGGSLESQRRLRVFRSGDDDESGARFLDPHWRADQSLSVALSDLFPMRIHPSLQDGDALVERIKADLTAVNLTRIAGLRMEGTNDLKNHLRLNQATGVVHVFHMTTVLKEHLLASRLAHTAACLPRHIALETLYTIQLLFQQDDKSRALHRNLVSKHGFDPDGLRFGTVPYESPGERDSASRFPIWGPRLMDLYDEIENPKPRGVVDAWLERRSKSRHVMMATIAGVIAAVILGVLTLCVSVFQTWISWQQWKGQAAAG